jgi:AmmeMemoRadiSam system protein A
MSSLADSEKKALLQIARRALVSAVEGRASAEEIADNSLLSRPGGAFVTISRAGRLRGCIGQLPAQMKLGEVVAHCARAVTSEDPRFPRVQPHELADIEIELSVLSEIREIKPEEIVPGRHGLLVSNGPRRGVLLPQVAQQFHWNVIRFLEATCEKAGLKRDAWKDSGTHIEAFTAEIFSEADFPAERSEH